MRERWPGDFRDVLFDMRASGSSENGVAAHSIPILHCIAAVRWPGKGLATIVAVGDATASYYPPFWSSLAGPIAGAQTTMSSFPS